MAVFFPDRHPIKDFFVLDVLDVAPRSDMASMAYPIFSLSTKPEYRELTYEQGGVSIEVIPSSRGTATVYDKDIWIYVISKLVAMRNRGEHIEKTVRITTHDLLVMTNRPTSGLGYQRLEDALLRLAGTTIRTTIKTDEDQDRVNVFHLIENYQYYRKGSMFAEEDRLKHLEIDIPDWLFQAIDNVSIKPINRSYFRLRRPIDRRIYEIVHKQIGSKKSWEIGAEKLQARIGSKQAHRNFMLHLRKTAQSDHLPDYSMEIQGNKVIFTHKATHWAKDEDFSKQNLHQWLKAETEARARAICQKKNYCYQSAKAQFVDMVLKIGTAPSSMDGALIDFCNKLKSQPKERY